MYLSTMVNFNCDRREQEQFVAIITSVAALGGVLRLPPSRRKKRQQPPHPLFEVFCFFGILLATLNKSIVTSIRFFKSQVVTHNAFSSQAFMGIRGSEITGLHVSRDRVVKRLII